MQEDLSFHAADFLSKQYGREDQCLTVKDILGAHQCDQTMFYIPGTREIMLLDRTKPDDQIKKNNKLLHQIDFDSEKIDELILSFNKKPTKLYDSFQRNVAILMPKDE